MQNINFDKARKISSSPFFIKSLFLADKSVSYKYIRYRILRPILKGYYKLFNLFKPNRPWTTPASIIIFENLLNKEMRGLEYGSGRSTMFFSKHLKELISIEHYSAWYKKVEVLLSANNIANVEYFYIPKDKDLDINDYGDDYNNRYNGDEERLEYQTYVNKVLEYDDDYFDFIQIDGRSRVNCGINAIPKLKSGGLFVLDNSERPRYKRLHEILAPWPKVDTTNGLTNTTIWFKP